MISNAPVALGEAIARGCSGIFGIAGGLAFDRARRLRPIAIGRAGCCRFGCAIHADIAGVDAPVIEAAGKRSLRDATSSVAGFHSAPAGGQSISCSARVPPVRTRLGQ
jgi:hypothetical protein